MTEMIAVAVVDLKAGPALDWAVAKASDLNGIELTMEFASKSDGSQSAGLVPWVTGARHPHKPSTDWSQGGPLIDEFNIWLKSHPTGAHQAAMGGPLVLSFGETKLEAAMRVIVFAKFGDAVSVPKALWGGK